MLKTKVRRIDFIALQYVHRKILRGLAEFTLRVVEYHSHIFAQLYIFLW